MNDLEWYQEEDEEFNNDSQLMLQLQKIEPQEPNYNYCSYPTFVKHQQSINHDQNQMPKHQSTNNIYFQQNQTELCPNQARKNQQNLSDTEHHSLADSSTNHTNVIDSTPFPSFSNIQRSVEILKSIVPELFHDQVINNIYSSVLRTFKHNHSEISWSQTQGQDSPVHQVSTINKPSEASIHSLSSRPIKRTNKINDKQALATPTYLHSEQRPAKLSPCMTFGVYPSRRYGRKSKKTQEQLATDGRSRYQKEAHKGSQMEQVERLQKIWNERYESALINAYKQYRSLSDIRDYFHKLYPQDRQAFTNLSIRSKVCKILRLGIRKFYNFLNRYDNKRLPPMKRINENASRGIIYNNDAIEARILLLDVYQLRTYDERIIAEAMRAITKYVDRLEHATKLNYLLDQSPSHPGNFAQKDKELSFYRSKRSYDSNFLVLHPNNQRFSQIFHLSFGYNAKVNLIIIILMIIPILAIFTFILVLQKVSSRSRLAGVSMTLITLIFLLYSCQNLIVYTPIIPLVAQYPQDNPQGFRHPTEVGLGTIDVQLQTSDNVKIRGWLISKQQNARLLEVTLKQVDLGIRMKYLQQLHLSTNSDILIIAYRGYSNSEGTPTEEGLQKDAEAILKYAVDYRQNQSAKGFQKDIYVLGRSMGGAVAIYSSVLTPFTNQIKGFILENTFTSIQEMMSAIFRGLSVLKPLMCNKWPSKDLIGSINHPILFVRSLLDETVPTEQMEQLFALATLSKLKRQYVIQQGRHNVWWQLDPDGYFGALNSFFEEVQKSSE